MAGAWEAAARLIVRAGCFLKALRGGDRDVPAARAPWIRLDSDVVAGYRVPPSDDSVVGTLIGHADDRAHCIARLARALRQFVVGPIRTTIPWHLWLMEQSGFRTGGVDTHLLERLFK